MNKNKYFLYARKSTDVEDKQIQSLDDQIRVMKKKASDLGLKIVDIFQESMSAKAPGRYKFNEMIGRINNGEASGIISWKLDRISRNPIDSGVIQYMLQNGALDKIITNDREYNPIDAGLLMSVENGMSNQFIIDLKKNTKRGLDSKYLKGIRPTTVPLGYFNIKETKTIDIDENRFGLIRGMWDLMLTGNYVPSEINTIYSDKFGLRTRKTAKRGGKKLTHSGIYRMFHNIFYTGYYYHNGELIKGIHKPMITLAEYDRVQILLGKKGNIRPKNYSFPFTGLIKCGECGCSITASKKFKYIKTNKETREYTYYHCTKSKRDVKCSQKPINGNELENQILEILNKIEIIPEFKSWAINIIKNEYEESFKLVSKKIENINRTISSEENQLKRLTDLLLKELISEEEFKLKKVELSSSILKLKDMRNDIDKKSIEIHDFTLDAFKFASKAKKSFINGDLDTKKNIFSSLGKNFILKDGKVTMDLNPWFKVIENGMSENNRVFNGVETLKKDINKGIIESFDSKSCFWYLKRESNPHIRR